MEEPIILNDRYQLEERLGTGGMALVYRAHDRKLERNVAVKILRQDFTQDQAFRERFRQEALAAANLSHPNIVTVHDFGLDRGRLYIVLEYLPGDNLKNLLQRRGRIPVDETLELMIQACAGVGYAHRAGIVHCDIKPHNFLITPDKRLKVTDFGIARALASIEPGEKSQVVWGSPQYFSPEQATGDPPSPASDVYSLGVILYEMLTGQLPFLASNPADLARQHRDEMPLAPRQINGDIPAALEQIVLKVLAKEPSARYRAADQLGRVLVTFSQQSSNGVEIREAAFPDTASSSQPPLPKPISGDDQPTPLALQPPDNSQVKGFPMLGHEGLNIDWITIALSLLALIAVGGLFPLYLWIFYLYQ